MYMVLCQAEYFRSAATQKDGHTRQMMISNGEKNKKGEKRKASLVASER
jgi:hypothetical protein